MTDRPTLSRQAAAELIGSAWLAVVVVGSGIAAQRLSPTDVGLQLAENAVATAAGLAVILLAVGPVPAAHLNPVISLADAWLGRRAGTGLTAASRPPTCPFRCSAAPSGRCWRT